jgi:nicotinamidase/pyrazinamidase
MNNPLKKGDALLIVDAQVDFFPGGALPVPDGEAILPVINEWIQAASENNIPLFFSRDWHPNNHCSFKENGGEWPMHCVQHTKGASLHPGIHLPSSPLFINKGQEAAEEAYSAFMATTEEDVSLITLLNEKNIKRIWLAGLAEDYCVYETALAGRAHGYEVNLILNATKPIAIESGLNALLKMEESGVVIHRT